MNIIVTMAGRGARFSDVGYPMPKPLIEVENKHVIEWTTRSLPFIEHYNKKTKQVIHFAVRKIDDEKFSIGLIGYQNFLNRVFTDNDIEFLSSNSINICLLGFLGRGKQNKQF